MRVRSKKIFSVNWEWSIQQCWKWTLWMNNSPFRNHPVKWIPCELRMKFISRDVRPAFPHHSQCQQVAYPWTLGILYSWELGTVWCKRIWTIRLCATYKLINIYNYLFGFDCYYYSYVNNYISRNWSELCGKFDSYLTYKMRDINESESIPQKYIANKAYWWESTRGLILWKLKSFWNSYTDGGAIRYHIHVNTRNKILLFLFKCRQTISYSM
jgi:hypothetical protein